MIDVVALSEKIHPEIVLSKSIDETIVKAAALASLERCRDLALTPSGAECSAIDSSIRLALSRPAVLAFKLPSTMADVKAAKRRVRRAKTRRDKIEAGDEMIVAAYNGALSELISMHAELGLPGSYGEAEATTRLAHWQAKFPPVLDTAKNGLLVEPSPGSGVWFVPDFLTAVTSAKSAPMVNKAAIERQALETQAHWLSPYWDAVTALEASKLIADAASIAAESASPAPSPTPTPEPAPEKKSRPLWPWVVAAVAFFGLRR